MVDLDINNLETSTTPLLLSSTTDNTNTGTITAPETLRTPTGKAYIEYTGYLDGDTESPVSISNVTKDDCKYPDTTGTGASYANCCSSVMINGLALNSTWGVHIYPEYFTPVIVPTTTAILRSFTLPGNCPHITYVEEPSSPISSSFLTTSFSRLSDTHLSRWTSIKCDIPPDECEKLVTTYYSQIDSFEEKYRGSTLDSDAKRESARIQFPPCKRGKIGNCDSCTIYADEVQVYWSYDSRSRDMCASEPVPFDQETSKDRG
jgi:hypothetical protein